MVMLVALNERAERGYGKVFDANPVLARTLKAINWADDAAVPTSAPIASPPAVVRDNPLDGLRREYMTAAGSAADKRWGAARLQNEISRRYQRRDMVPEA